MPDAGISVFDPNITAGSPAGSCLLKVLRAASGYHIRLFTVKTDLPSSPCRTIVKLPVPMKPVFLQSILFTVFSVLFSRKRAAGLSISTQGGFPFCDISYAHCCHKLFLTQYRENITGGLFTRSARLLNHYWSAGMEAIAFRRAKVIVVPSEGLAAELTAAYPATSPKLRVISNPVDWNAFSGVRVSAPERPFTFAFCALGNFDWKGLPLILQALATGIPARLQVIGGSAPDMDRYRHLSDQVTFVGFQEDIRPYLWASHAFVFPSVYETFPLVCLQAAAAGLPLIATNLYGLEHLLQHGVSGWRVQRTVDSLVQAMREAVADPIRTAAMGSQAQSLAQKYDEPAFQQRWLELIREMVSD